MSELNWTVWSDGRIEMEAMRIGNVIETLEAVDKKLEKIGYKKNDDYEPDSIEAENVRGLLKALIAKLYNEIEEPA